jgi:hypothetical protein
MDRNHCLPVFSQNSVQLLFEIAIIDWGRWWDALETRNVICSGFSLFDAEISGSGSISQMKVFSLTY